MKRILLSIVLFINLFAIDKILSKTQALDLLKVTPIYHGIAPQLGKTISLKGVEQKDFYILTIVSKQGNSSLYITHDKKYTILGQVYDNLKHKIIIPHYPVDKNIVKKGVVFSFGEGKKDLYIVTDPECPFCREFEKKAKTVNLTKDYKIHLIFLPLSFHKESKDMIYYILAGKSKKEQIERFHKTLQGDNSWRNFKVTKNQKEKFDKKIEVSKKAANELGAQGTPSFYDSKFNEINRNELLK